MHLMLCAAVQVNWEYMNKDLLEKFWRSTAVRKALRKTLPDCMAVRGGRRAAADAVNCLIGAAGWCWVPASICRAWSINS